mgnify:CR=1 FL=1
MNLICYYMECCPPESIVLASEDFDSPLSDAILYVQNHLSEQISVPQMRRLPVTMSAISLSFSRNGWAFLPVSLSSRKKRKQLRSFSLPQIFRYLKLQSRWGLSAPFTSPTFSKSRTGMTPSTYRNIYLRTHLQ